MKTMMSCAMVLCVSPLATGAVAYDNFGPGNSYDPAFDHYVVQAPTDDFGPGLSIRPGFQFVSAATGAADTFKLRMSNSVGTPGAVLRLYADTGSNTIGVQIGDAVNIPVTGVVSTFDVSGAGWNLATGGTYWVTAQAATASIQLWSYNSMGALGWNDAALGSNGTAHNYDGPNGAPHGVFAITVSAVPAPASGALLGLAGVVAARRRRRA